ncbi:MAG: ABA4-like family protein [Vicinamibacterales bacterium]|nr:ABA4-like family protein [Vicinamibacterales bacterium]
MTADQVFSIVNPLALVSWGLLVVLPGRKWVTDVVTGLAVPALLAIVYTAIIAVNFFGSPGGFSSLPDVALLFSNQWLLLAGWTHYLVFDLLIGTWEVRDAQERGVPHLALVPCLILTFLFGPAGWLLYQAVRKRGRVPFYG